MSQARPSIVAQAVLAGFHLQHRRRQSIWADSGMAGARPIARSRDRGQAQLPGTLMEFITAIRHSQISEFLPFLTYCRIDSIVVDT